MFRIGPLLALVTLFFASACSKDTSPKACFEMSKSTVKVGDTLYLFNCATNYSQWTWFLPNGVAVTRHTQLVASSAGNYSVKLLVGDIAFKDTNSVTRSFTVQ
jgi:PKD repeat protein